MSNKTFKWKLNGWKLTGRIFQGYCLGAVVWFTSQGVLIASEPMPENGITELGIVVLIVAMISWAVVTIFMIESDLKKMEKN